MAQAEKHHSAPAGVRQGVPPAPGGLQGSRSARYEEETRQAAIDVLEQNGITFGPERLSADTQLRPLTVTRDRESEAQVAQTLLGSAERQGENEVRQLYVGEGGTAEFSMNGAPSPSPSSREPG